jgi:hypothetical protein
MKTARYALWSIAFLTPAAWLAMLLGCVKYGADWPSTCEPVNYAAVPLAIGALVAAWFGVVHLRKAHRTATRGWPRRIVGPWAWRTLAHGVKAVWEGGEEPGLMIVGEVRFTRRRWLIPVANGQTVLVDRVRFWHWLEAVDALQRTLPPGQSAISMRRWKNKKFEGLKVSEGEVLAFREILKAVGAVEYRTRDARSMYYVAGQGATWGRVEAYEKLQESEEY